MMIERINDRRWFWIFTLSHIFIWALIPIIVRHTLPMDALEGATWGHQFQWGYDKNPFLNAWLTEIGILIGGQSGWLIYLFSQFFIALSFWVVWRLGRKIISPVLALLAVLLLESIQYFNIASIDFDDNVLEIGLWALGTYSFYLATKHQRMRDWIILSIVAALAMMAKYYSAMLLASFALFLLINVKARKSFKYKGIYLSIILFLILIAPHFIWLFNHNFITLHYAFHRANTISGLSFNPLYGVQFIYQQLLTFIPVLLCFGVLFLLRKKGTVLNRRVMLLTFDKQFLFIVGFVPFLLTVIFSFITGAKLHQMWGMPLLTLWSLCLMIWLQPILRKKQFMVFYFLMLFLMLLGGLLYGYSQIKAGNTSSGNYPSRAIASSVTNLWHQRFGKTLKYVGGSRFGSGIVGLYSKDRPSVYIDWDPNISTWIKDNEVRKNGAVFVWRPEQYDQTFLLKSVKKRFPLMEEPKRVKYYWYRNKNIKPLELYIAILPPEKNIL